MNPPLPRSVTLRRSRLRAFALGAGLLVWLLAGLAAAPAPARAEDAGLQDVLGDLGTARRIEEGAEEAVGMKKGEGAVAGRVFDAAAGTPLRGVTVILVWPAPAGGGEPHQDVAVTDADGAYAFPSVPPGTYSLSFIKSGYRNSTMRDFEVVADKTNPADFPLPPLAAGTSQDVLELEEFVVEQQTVEEMMTSLELRTDSDQLLNVMSAEDFAKFAAGDVAEALSRVSGVSIVEGQFAVIRGLDDRYSSTLYNGAPVPSPDPDRQSVQLDLFPSDVVSNLLVSKTFSPEQPSNSAAGSVNIVTIDYPDDWELKLSASGGYNANAKDRFLEFTGHTRPDPILQGVDPMLRMSELRDNGVQFIGGNPVGRESEKDGNFLDDVGDVLKTDYNATFGGRGTWENREFRLKGVATQEIKYDTAEGFQQTLRPAPPVFGPGSVAFDPVCVCIVTIPGALEKSGDLSLGQLSLTQGKYDLTTSVYQKNQTAYGGVGVNLDEAGNHHIDGSIFYTKKKEQIVQLRENGQIEGLDYAGVFNRQLTGTAFGTLTSPFIAPGSPIGSSLRNDATDSQTNGNLVISNFYRSQSFERHRDLKIYQLNGDHRFELFPGLHVDWAANWARTHQEEVSLGMDYAYEPCGFAAGSNNPCPDGVSPIQIGDSFTPLTPAELGPGKYVANNRLTFLTNKIEENSSFYGIDGDYTFDVSEQLNVTVAGGYWREKADRAVDSAFLQGPGFDNPSDCLGAASSQVACLNDTARGLGRMYLDNLALQSGLLANLRLSNVQASRDIDAYDVRGKLTFFQRVDLLGGIRREGIHIESLNSPFIYTSLGLPVYQLGGPLTFPSRYLFFDRLDNPFQRTIPGVGVSQEVIPSQLPGPDFPFNDKLLGTTQPAGPCLGDNGTVPGITCVDLLSQAQLQQAFNGVIDERQTLKSAGFAIRPLEGMTFRGAWSQTVARPSFREMGFYVSVEPGSDDFIVGNPALQLSPVKSWDLRLEYTWGELGDLVAVSGFKKEIQDPIESIVVRDPTNAAIVANDALYRTFFNNPNTAHLKGVEAELSKSFDFFGPKAPEWLKYWSIGGNFTYIEAKVDRTEAELARSKPFFGVSAADQELFTELEPTRRLYNQPKWIANANLSFDHPEWGTKFTLAYFAISDVLDAAGSATLAYNGQPVAFTLDRYLEQYYELRATLSQELALPDGWGTVTFSATAKNLTDSRRGVKYDPSQTNGTIAEREYRVGRSYSLGLKWKLTF